MPPRERPDLTSTTTVKLTPEQQGLVSQAYPTIKNFTPPTLPEQPDQLIAPFNQTQLQAQDMAVAGAPVQQATMAGANQANQHLTNTNILSADSNPALASYMTAANRPVIDAYLQDVMPAIDSGAADVGQFGSSRRGVAQGIAAKGLTQAVGDTNAKIASAGYGQGLNAMLQAMGLSGSVASGMNIPAATVGAVGDVRQQQQQAAMDATQGAKWTNQMMPWNLAMDQIGAAGAIPGGSTESSVPQQPVRLLPSLLGGGLAGAGAIPGRPGIGAMLGALGGLGSYFAT